MNKFTGVFVLAFLIAVFLPAHKSIACSCGGRLSPPGAYNLASDVFRGKVIEISPPAMIVTRGKDGSVGVSYAGTPGVVKLSVIESFKGSQGKEVKFDAGWGGCFYPFVVGEEYLVYADREKGKLTTGQCDRTRPLSKASQDLKYIRGLQSGEAQAILFGYVFRQIIDAQGQLGNYVPFEELTVIAESKDSRIEVIAEKSGEYDITLPPGSYKVWVERSGKRVSTTEEMIALKNGDSTLKVLTVKF